MMKRIGILGGMGPLATNYFLNLLIESINESLHPRNDQEFPDMTLLMESSMPDRTISIKEEESEAKERINACLDKLHTSGCEILAIPCVTAHAFVDSNWFRRGVIDFRSVIARQHDDGKNRRVAVMATDGSVISGVFMPLAQSFELIYPNDKLQLRIMNVTYGDNGLKSHDTDRSSCLRELTDIKAELHENGADLIIAGCTEIEMFLATHNSVSDCILPMKELCEEIIMQLNHGN
jgi:aspartate racemase